MIRIFNKYLLNSISSVKEVNTEFSSGLIWLNIKIQNTKYSEFTYRNKNERIYLGGYFGKTATFPVMTNKPITSPHF